MLLCNASTEMRFVEATAQQQTALLNAMAWPKNASPEVNPGIEFFAVCRRMVADAYYTSPVGYKELGHRERGMASFSVPRAG